MSVPSAVAGRLGPVRVSISPDAARWLGLLALLAVTALIAARFSTSVFVGTGLAMLAVLGVLAYRAPQLMVIALVFAPILDRYIASVLLPERLWSATNLFSEGLLLVVGLAVAGRAWQEGALLRAFRHPVTAALGAFTLVAAASAVVNGVAPLVAAAGIVFTIDAAALFFLPRLARLEERHATAAMVTFVAMATLAGVLGLSQVILHPNFLGLETFSGRFSEGNRVAAFLDNPNMLGVVLAMALPFALIGTSRGPTPRWRTAAWVAAVILTLALFYTFSRGAWLGVVVAMLVVGIGMERRALLVLVLLAVLSYASAHVIPRGILASEEERPGPGFDIGGATLGRLDALDDSDLRVLFIENAVPIMADHPVLGAGPGRYGGAIARDFESPLYETYTAGRVPRDRTVDNFWLHLAVEVGALGALLFAAAIAMAILQALGAGLRSVGMRRLLLGGSATLAILVAVDSTVEMLLEGNTTSFAMWFFLGTASVLAGGRGWRREG